MKRSFRCILFFLLTVFPHLSLASIQTPAGWIRTGNNQAETITFKPQNKKDQHIVVVKYYPKTLLEGHTVESWLSQKLNTSSAPQGKWSSTAQVNKMTSNFARGKRQFNVGKQNKIIEVFAISYDLQYVRLSAIVRRSDQQYKPWQKSANQIAADLVNIEKQAAINENRGIIIEASPPDVKGIKKGGKIKAGRYVGTKVKENEVLGHFELLLFDNGEYKFVKGYKNKSGRYEYSPMTGRLNISKDFKNSKHRPYEEFSVFGVEQKTGKPIIYAEDYWGMGTYIFRLRRVADINQPPPSEVERQKALAEKEAKRYKHVTQPGKGVKNKDIEAIVYTFDTKMTVGGLEKDEAAYLLLKDGSVMDGVPVPPDSLDINKSRSREPDRWGRWKNKGGEYVFAWPANPKEYKAPSGKQFIAIPIKKGTRIHGNWGSSSSFSNGNFSSVRFWGIKFSSKGRFNKYKNGMMQGGGEMNSAGPLLTTAWDDEGTTTSVIGSNIGGGKKTKNNKPGSDRMGWYEFENYTLVLKYDNGTVERIPSFSKDTKSLKTIWVDKETLRKKDKKK
jgi:hypothetical protein